MRFFFFILIIPIFLFSQNFEAGFIGGVSMSQVSGDNLSGFNKIGPRIGLFVNRDVNRYNLQLELHYQTKGSRKTINYSDQNNYTDNLNYNPEKPIVGERIKRSESVFFKVCYFFHKLITFTFTGESI